MKLTVKNKNFLRVFLFAGSIRLLSSQVLVQAQRAVSSRGVFADSIKVGGGGGGVSA